MNKKRLISSFSLIFISAFFALTVFQTHAQTLDHGVAFRFPIRIDVDKLCKSHEAFAYKLLSQQLKLICLENTPVEELVPSAQASTNESSHTNTDTNTPLPTPPSVPDTTTPTTQPNTPTTSSGQEFNQAKYWIPSPPADKIFAGIPSCPSHNVGEWHALYDPIRNCHYDHEHKDNPTRVNDIFGPVGSLYGGTSISYPWQTWAGHDFNKPAVAGKMENELKHTGYLWLVRRQSDFKPEVTPSGQVVQSNTTCYTKEAENCITDFRVQVHSIFSQIDANVRFHSYWMEARGCKVSQPDLCGTIKTGGIVDYGHLLVDDVPVSLPQDDPNIFGLFSTTGRRVHGGDKTRVLGGDAVWYAQSFMAAPSILGNAWGPINRLDPTQTLFYCSDPDRCKKNNGSILEADVVEISGPNYQLRNIDGTSKDLDGKKDGVISYKGYTTRFGKVVDQCAPLGIDCIPLEIKSLPLGPYQYRDSEHGLGAGGLLDYDTAPANEFWIQYQY